MCSESCQPSRQVRNENGVVEVGPRQASALILVCRVPSFILRMLCPPSPSRSSDLRRRSVGLESESESRPVSRTKRARCSGTRAARSAAAVAPLAAVAGASRWPRARRGDRGGRPPRPPARLGERSTGGRGQRGTRRWTSATFDAPFAGAPVRAAVGVYSASRPGVGRTRSGMHAAARRPHPRTPSAFRVLRAPPGTRI